jgi:16S rRNA (guanine527-N7)-methyltransferase
MDALLERRLRELAGLIAQSPHNLVARGERDRVFDAHVSECVAYAEHLPFERGQGWLDLGSGGGLPGLVLAAVRPDTQWTLVDSVAKKTSAIAAFASSLGLENVTVLTGRAEELAREPALRGAFDGAIARAVAALPVLAELLRGFVGDGGVVVAAKGPKWAEEMESARAALRMLKLDEERVVPVPSAARRTWLVMMRARGAPPADFPRRTGLPRSRPLGGL